MFLFSIFFFFAKRLTIVIKIEKLLGKSGSKQKRKKGTRKKKRKKLKNIFYFHPSSSYFLKIFLTFEIFHPMRKHDGSPSSTIRRIAPFPSFINHSWFTATLACDTFPFKMSARAWRFNCKTVRERWFTVLPLCWPIRSCRVELLKVKYSLPRGID